MRQLMIAPALALLVAGCGGRAPEAERNVTEVNSEEAVNVEAEANATGNATEASNATAAVLKLNDAQRNGVFYRALADAGLECAAVSSSERMEDQDGQPVWRANCKGLSKVSHIITVTPDGMVHTISRADR